MTETLDIVSFAVPYPPNYGGVIDVYYRLRSLLEQGVSIRLHCFTYHERFENEHLDALCPVFYYSRSWRFKHHLGKIPFIVSSRKAPQLLEQLGLGKGPVLFEGLHTCGWITAPQLAHRKKIVRMHNVESTYYAHLASEAKGLRATHFKRESRKLKHFERTVLKAADLILPISDLDFAHFEQQHENVKLLPAFHPFTEIDIKDGRGEYVLVQGDLSIVHNLRILTVLAPICKKLGVRCVAAGRLPSQEGLDLLSQHENIEIYSDVPQDEMIRLMHYAQVHVVDAQTTAGFKLKLLASLFTARHVLAHVDLLDDQLNRIAHGFSTPVDLERALRDLIAKPASVQDIVLRKSVLLPRFSNAHNAKQLMDALNRLS